MNTLLNVIKDAERRKTAVGHFNFSTLDQLWAIFRAAFSLKLPVIVGVSEGERDFVGVRQAAAIVKSLREEYSFPIFLNADHTHSLDRVKEAVEAGYDAVLFDGGKLPFEDNVKKTKEAVEYVKSKRADILVEGELGYIGSSSQILKEIPEGAAVTESAMTKPEEAAEFAKETGIDLLAPAVGNIHGMLKDAPNPRLNIKLISEIKKAAGVPLVLHGGSGISDEDFKSAIEVGISVIHISTELRFAWRKALESSLKEMGEELAPYKIMSRAVLEVGKIVENRLRLFNRF